jgi:hypothetical protein
MQRLCGNLQVHISKARRLLGWGAAGGDGGRGVAAVGYENHKSLIINKVQCKLAFSIFTLNTRFIHVCDRLLV